MNRERYRLWKNEEGATSVEYGLMVSLIAGVIALAVSGFGVEVRNLFNAIVLAFP